MPFATAVPGALSEEDVAELARGYARDGGWSGALALYGSMLREGDALRTIAKEAPLKVPTLAIDRSGSDFTLQTLSAVHAATVHGGIIEGVGHYIAMVAPEKLAGVLLDFVADASLRD